jgi:hypothetical protein
MRTNAKQCLYFAHTWPRAKASAASERVFGLMKLFHKNNLSIDFICSGAKPSTTQNSLQSFSYVNDHDLNPNNHEKVIEHFSRYQTSDIECGIFDTFVAEEFFGHHFHRYFPEKPLILDTQDIHSLRKYRQEKFLELYGQICSDTRKVLQMKISDILSAIPTIEDPIHVREMASVFRSDLVIVVSDYEQMLLEKRYGLTNIVKSQFYYEMQEGDGQMGSDSNSKLCNANCYNYDRRSHFVWIGSFLHDPNVKAVELLLEHIWPEIRRQLPKAELHIYGSDFPKKFEQIERIDGVKKKNLMQDLKSLSKYRVLLAPIYFGAGIKGKVTDSWFNYLPVVTTPVGAVGLFLESYDNDVALNTPSSTPISPNDHKTTQNNSRRNPTIESYYQYNPVNIRSFENQLTFGGLFSANSSLMSGGAADRGRSAFVH